MNLIERDITTIETGTIVHQVNRQGKMNSGVAKAIREKWPSVFNAYENSFHSKNPYQLGDVQTVEVVPFQLYVANLFGQENFGYDGKRYTSYAAWERALPLLKKHQDSVLVKSIYFPYLIGCDRGGGNFLIISEMIKEYFPYAIFCKI
jgi:O-acetyl-ADP-ribose deacetylase (regulator of RNase III)